MFKKLVQKYWSLFFIGVFLAIVLIFVLIKGEGIYIQIHDTLDNNIVWLKMLKDNNLFWEREGLVPFLGGVDRNYLYSPLKAYIWLYMIFPVFPAIIIGWYIKIIISISGFLFLGKVIEINNNEKFNLIVLAGFFYGILPTLPSCAIEFASIPFLLCLLILFYKKFNWGYLIGIFFFPVFSRFAVFGIFFCGYIVLFFLFDWFVKKRPSWKMILAMIVLAMGYILTEWRLFYMMIFSNEETIRSSIIINYTNLLGAIKDSANVFTEGQYHCGSLHSYVVLPACLLYFVYINFKYIKNNALKNIFLEKFNWLIAWILFNCAVYGLDELKGFREIVRVVIPPLEGFGFSRSIWTNPFLWYFAFLIVLCKISKDIIKYVLVFFAFSVLCFKPSTYNHIYWNLRISAQEIFKGIETDELTYNEFYSEKLFEEIKKEIGYNSEWSIAFGMHPAVLEYNGIATLDGYFTYYPLNYKKKFRKLIEPELKIDKDNKNYYDNWGGRAYIFSNEVSYLPVKKMEVNSAVLNIDPNVFRELGGKYIFSRVEVINLADLGLEEVGIYSSSDSPYIIYVYRVR